MPNNKQIDDTLKYVIDNSPVDTSKLSPDGQRLVQDTRDIIETARVIVAEKNADELFQNFVWHTRDVGWDNAKKDPNDVLPVDKQKARDDAKLGLLWYSSLSGYSSRLLLISQPSNICVLFSLSFLQIPKSGNSSPISPLVAVTSLLVVQRT